MIVRRFIMKPSKLNIGEKGHLSDLSKGQVAKVLGLHNENPAVKRRLLDMGITTGVNISITNIPAYLENSADPMISVKATTSFENSLNWFNNLANKLLEVKNAIKYDTSVKAVVEAYMLQICRGN
jgi:hypothetical protein